MGTHRRGGQAGPADGLGAGVQGGVLGLVQDGVHAEGLLAVHRHHDCGLREGLWAWVGPVRVGSGRTGTPRAATEEVKKRKEEEEEENNPGCWFVYADFNGLTLL